MDWKKLLESLRLTLGPIAVAVIQRLIESLLQKKGASLQPCPNECLCECINAALEHHLHTLVHLVHLHEACATCDPCDK